MVALARRIQGLEATVATLTKSGEDQSARFQGAPPPPLLFCHSSADSVPRRHLDNAALFVEQLWVPTWKPRRLSTVRRPPT